MNYDLNTICCILIWEITMNLFEHMDALVPTYTKNDYYIYDKCKKFTHTFATKSITELTKDNGISQAALTRFAQKLGFSGFNEFQFALALQLKENTKENQKQTRAQTYGNILEKTEETVQVSQLKQIAKMITDAQHIYTTGYSIASIPARNMDMSFKMLSDKHSEYIAFGNMPLHFPKQSVLFLFSAESGKAYTSFVKDKAEQLSIVLVTMNPKHPLRHYAGQTVVLPRVGLVNVGRTVMPETFAFFMFIDLLFQHIEVEV